MVNIIKEELSMEEQLKIGPFLNDEVAVRMFPLQPNDDENEEEVYTGNMFSNFEEQLKELDKNKKD